jgi:putative inorganic carbon (HCO3(-)) transporter
MTAELARAGGPIACAGLAVLLLARGRWERLAGLALAALGAVFLAIYLAPQGHRPVLAAAAVVGLGGAGALAALLRRWPWLVAIGALACAPARIPVHVGSTDANLLIPLYGIVAAAALLMGWELVRHPDDRRSRELGPLAWPLAALVLWSGLSLEWSKDLRQGAIELLFFFVPFSVLAVALARLPWNRRWLTILYAQLVLMAVAFAVIGVYQYATRDVFWNPKVIVGNAYAPFYRVNSVFWDPSIYGRFLVVAIIASLVVVLYGQNRRIALASAAAIAATWVGLLFSFSQSSFASLIVATLIAAALAWRWRVVVALALAGAVILSVGFSAGPVRNSFLHRSKAGLNSATSGRTSLIANGARIALHHPVEGVGLGGFKRAYAERLHLRGEDPKSAASHNTPVTVAAETGFPGLLILVWLVAAVLLAAFRRLDRGFESRAMLVFGLSSAVVAVHSLFYNALFEDPMFWALLGLIALAGRAATARSAES